MVPIKSEFEYRLTIIQDHFNRAISLSRELDESSPARGEGQIALTAFLQKVQDQLKAAYER